MLVGRELKKAPEILLDIGRSSSLINDRSQENPRWPRGKIKRPGEMLVGREIKESAIEKRKSHLFLS